MMRDEQIIELYFGRDERALVETSDKYGNYCRSISRSILNDEESAKECFNDTLYHSWNAIPPKRPNSLKTFVGKIIRNLSLNRLEKALAKKRGGGEAEVAIDELVQCLEDKTIQNAEQLEESLVIREVMDQFMAELKPQNRRIFVRRYWYCSSVREIAVAMGLSESNVEKSLYRVRGQLRKALEKAGVVV